MYSRNMREHVLVRYNGYMYSRNMREHVLVHYIMVIYTVGT